MKKTHRKSKPVQAETKDRLFSVHLNDQDTDNINFIKDWLMLKSQAEAVRKSLKLVSTALRELESDPDLKLAFVRTDPNTKKNQYNLVRWVI